MRKNNEWEQSRPPTSLFPSQWTPDVSSPCSQKSEEDAAAPNPTLGASIIGACSCLIGQINYK